ncbi:MAG: hypothetical protein SVX43_20700 [Cyanobacteriota bacterium]|nr:hypothetical protein [Cyanobacteriota bacterium]
METLAFLRALLERSSLENLTRPNAIASLLERDEGTTAIELSSLRAGWFL